MGDGKLLRAMESEEQVDAPVVKKQFTVIVLITTAPTAEQRWMEDLTMAEWRVYEADTPQCTHCGMWMPFARYRRGQGTNARKITDFCPSCGKKMTAMPMCGSCAYGNGEWKDDGICFACREQVWIPGKPHRQVGNEK